MAMCPGCDSEYERLGQHWQGDCGPYCHVEMCDDTDCGVCGSWRHEKRVQALWRLIEWRRDRGVTVP